MSAAELSSSVPRAIYRPLDSALMNAALTAALQAKSSGDVPAELAQDLFVLMNAIPQPDGYCGRNIRTCRLMLQAAGRYTLLSGEGRFQKVVKDSWTIFKPLLVGDIEINITRGAAATARVISSWLLMRSPWFAQSPPAAKAEILKGLGQFTHQRPKTVFDMDVAERAVDAWLELLDAVDVQSLPYGNEAELFIQGHPLPALEHCLNSSHLDKAHMDIICGVLEIVDCCPAALSGNPARSQELMEALARILIAYPERRALINGILDKNVEMWADYFPIDTLLGQGRQGIRTSSLLLARLSSFTEEQIVDFCAADFSNPEAVCLALETAAAHPALLRVSPKTSARLLQAAARLYYTSEAQGDRIHAAIEKHFSAFARHFPSDVILCMDGDVRLAVSSLLLARLPYFKRAFVDGMREAATLRAFWNAPPESRSPLCMGLDKPTDVMRCMIDYLKTGDSATLKAVHPADAWLLGDYLGVGDKEFYAYLELALKVAVSTSVDLEEIDSVLALATSEIDRHGADFDLIQQHCIEQLNMAFGEAAAQEYRAKYSLSTESFG